MNVHSFKLEENAAKLLLVVGGGLVGSAILRQLLLSHNYVLNTAWKNSDWLSPLDLINHTKELISLNKVIDFEIVWAAGKGGFSSSLEDMHTENKFFESYLLACSEFNSLSIKVNLISSAGGIYENSELVESIDQISPSRPYAHSKLQQERFLAEIGLVSRVYRLSSVYGIGGTRIGLVTNLLAGANFRYPVVIYANQNTLRDYIWNVDCAKQVVTDIVEERALGVRVVASGRPTSIFMLSNIVRSVTGKPILENYRPDGTNEKNILFSLKMLDSNYTASSLESSLSLINKTVNLAGKAILGYP